MIRGIGWRTGLATACLIVTLAAIIAALALTLTIVSGGVGGNAYTPLLSISLSGSCAVVGWLIASRRSGNSIGWVFLGIGFWQAIEAFAAGAASYGLVLHPGSIPLAPELAWVTVWAWAPGYSLFMTFALLLFPDGHLLSQRWRPVAWAAALMMVLLTLPVAISTWPLRGVALLASSGDNPFQTAGLLMLPVLALASVASIVLRFRRSTGQERQQLKWFTGAAAVEVSVIVIGTFSGAPSPAALVALAILIVPLVPVAVGIAILRYRLYEIDRIISRTIGWLVMSAILGTVFVVVIVGLQTVLAGVTANNTLAVAASTLVVAALFAPVRTRVQRAVDRRFQRARYVADRTAAAFAAHLRQVVDLETLRAELRTVIGGTLQPSSVRVWVRQASEKGSPGMNGADDHATHP